MKKLITVAVGLAGALAMSACSSSGGSSNTPATSAPAGGTTAGTMSGSGSSGSNGVSAASAFEHQFLKAPSTIGITQPLSKKPATGKFLVGLDSGSPSAKVLAQYWEQAAKDLGWKYKDIILTPDPEAQQKAMESAIALKPNGILTSGIPISTIKSQLADAKAQGIWVNTSASTDQPSGAMFDTSIADTAQLDQWGKMVAAYVVAESNGKANIQDFSLPIYPILEEFDKSFQASIKQWCATGCQVSEHPQQGSDIGTKTPQDVVSVVQANPSTNWLIFDLGDLEIGVDAALAAASASGLHIGGLTADTPNLQGLKAKKQDVWTAYSLPIVGYRQVDSFARKFNGDPIVKTPLPTQLITQDNVNSLVVDKAGNYVGVKNYRQEFLKLWHVSG